jgi:hypothetical protein
MSENLNATPSGDDLKRIIDSAQRLGVEIDEEEALQWLTAIAATHGRQDQVVIDEAIGVFGHRVSMLDFSPADLAHFREIGRLVEFEDIPGQVETALALSGSAAQSKIQSYPGDADYFERVNIIAPTRSEACRVLGDLIRKKALDTERGPSYQLIEVKYGEYPVDVIRDGREQKAGTPVSWTAAEVKAGGFDVQTPDGEETRIRWEDLYDQPGWCKLDWVIADSVRNQLANASNMLDATWEAPDGSITPLDGYLDPYFQEIYLEADSVPIFSKLAKHVSTDALDDYVKQLEHEVNKYLTKEINYGKAAKRMYNVFRLTGRYEEAAFLRELFDEPATMLYQVWSLIRTIDDCCNPDSPITAQQMISQCDRLILSVVEALEGEQESEIVRLLLRLRDNLTPQETGHELSTQAEAARAEVINVVNNFFYERLTAVPEIKEYIEGWEEGK